mmetsp:Transcript_41038/g.55929  ORF Transcript_41038/g.55929 Transcript_41038/m.55929 type:complete len:265 (-) Transcript_41038:34-828(-)
MHSVVINVKAKVSCEEGITSIWFWLHLPRLSAFTTFSATSITFTLRKIDLHGAAKDFCAVHSNSFSRGLGTVKSNESAASKFARLSIRQPFAIGDLSARFECCLYPGIVNIEAQIPHKNLKSSSWVIDCVSRLRLLVHLKPSTTIIVRGRSSFGDFLDFFFLFLLRLLFLLVLLSLLLRCVDIHSCGLGCGLLLLLLLLRSVNIRGHFSSNFLLHLFGFLLVLFGILRCISLCCLCLCLTFFGLLLLLFLRSENFRIFFSHFAR